MYYPIQFHIQNVSQVLTILCVACCASQALAQNQSPVRRTPGVAAFQKAIDMAPIDAVSLAVVPDAKSLGEDMGELAAKLQRMQALTEMKPLDLLKSQFGIGPGMNDGGAFVVWFMVAADQSLRWCALIPTTDNAQFLHSNLQATPIVAPDAFEWRGQTVYAKNMQGFVVISENPELARSYAPKPGLAERLQTRLGERGFAVLCDGEIGLWAGPQSLADIQKGSQQAEVALVQNLAAAKEKDNSPADTKVPAQDSSARARVSKLMQGLTDGVLSIDIDPLGVLLRSYAVLDPASELGKSARGGVHAGVNLNRLPRGPFVMAAAADMDGLGGTQAFLDLAAQIPGGEQVPAWLEQNKNISSAIQFAIYPSKLGVVGGGILNDAMLWISTTDSAKVNSILEQWMLSLSGEVDGQMREVTWEKDRVLKNTITTNAYAMKDIPLPKNGQPARKANPMQRMARSLVFGPKGPNGFVKTFPDGVFVTFSQRPDVLEKAAKTAAGANSLETDPVITALRAWMMPKPDALAFIGVGSLLNVVRQAANMFPVGGFELPDAPPDLEPIAFALCVNGGKIETSTMIPTNVIGVAVTAVADRNQVEEDEQDDQSETSPASDPKSASDNATPMEPKKNPKTMTPTPNNP